MSFADQVADLTKVAENIPNDTELHDALRPLHQLAIEADSIGTRFEAAMLRVRSILADRLSAAR